MPGQLLRLGGNLFADRKFTSNILKIGVPIALQNLVTSSLALLDNVMIGQLGEAPIAAVSLANQVFFLFLLFIFGLGSGSIVFTAQYWGRGDLPMIRRVLGLCLFFSLAGGIAAAAASLTVPSRIISLFSTDTEVIEVGAGYLSIVGISFVFFAVTFSFSMVLRSMEQTRLPLFTTVISLSFNALFNYLLIFGNLGFPRMGVNGAAIATAGARFLEMILLLIILRARKNPLLERIGDYLKQTLRFLGKYLKTVFPVIGNEVGWALGMIMFKFVYARMGTEEIAAITITEMVVNLAIVAFFGTSNACAVMVGNTIGRGRTSTAYLYALRFALLGPLLGAAVGIIIGALSPVFPLMFNISPLVRRYVIITLLITAVLMPLKIFNFHTIVGILRSGGDTAYSMYVDVGSVWGTGVVLAIVGGLVLGLPLPWVFLLVQSEEFVKAGFGYRRLRSRRWIRKLT
jgi:putative MATE family efflux protein